MQYTDKVLEHFMYSLSNRSHKMKKWMLFLLIIFLSMTVEAEEKELDITVDTTYQY